MDQVQVLDTPIKSQNDSREYRTIKLPNGLKAVLVHKSDEKGSEQQSEDIAAFNISIRVGSFDDPPHIQGLAHFLEHLIFMGSKKYPEEESFGNFLENNGGSTNGQTAAEETFYDFQVSTKAFPEALDRFTSLLFSPLLLKETMQREREAVDSEFQMGYESAHMLAEHVLKASIRESHPASQMSCGNLKTLKDDISDDDLHREVNKLFKKYTANRMNLAIQSKLSLDEMQALVVANFSAFKADSDVVFNPDFSNKMIIMKPNESLKKLWLTWVAPSARKLYKTKPIKYLSKIFGNDGKGGLSTYLRDRQWITSLSFGAEKIGMGAGREFCLPILDITLTDLGAKNINEVLESVYSYLSMIKETPIEDHRRLYNQIKDSLELKFRFDVEENAENTVRALAETMCDCDDVDTIRGRTIFQTFDETVIKSTIDMICQRKFNLLLIDDEHQTFDKKEKFFGTEYQEIDFPEAFEKLWDERQLKAEFFLEKANPFTAMNFEIFVNEQEALKFPVKIVDDEIYEVWHKLDDKFKTPKVLIDVELLSPKVMSSIESFLLLKIYNEMLSKFLTNKFSQAASAELKVKSQNELLSLKLEFGGFNDKMDALVEMTLKELKYFNDHMDHSTFDSLKTQMKKSYYNRINSFTSRNYELLKEMLNERHHSSVDLYNGVDALTLDNLQKFITKFYARLRVKVLVHGNYRKSDALKIVEILKENLDCKPLEDSYELKTRNFQIPLGVSVLRAKSLIANSDNSKLYTIFEVGKDTLRTASLYEILESILGAKAFDFLRNKEQLGYSVGIHSFTMNGIILLNVFVSSQESKHSYAKVQQKMETFTNEIAEKTIENLSDEEFDIIKKSQVERLMAAPSSLEREKTELWNEISKEEYVFDRTELKAKVMKSLTKMELQEFYNSFAQPNHMRKLRIQVIGNDGSSENENTENKTKNEFITEKLAEDENVIEDIEHFKTNMAKHPFIRFSIN